MLDDRRVNLTEAFVSQCRRSFLSHQLVSHHESSSSSTNEIIHSHRIREKNSTSLPNDICLQFYLTFSYNFVAVQVVQYT